MDLQPCIQLDNVSVAIATAEQHEAVPPACVMDSACGNVQSEVPVPFVQAARRRRGRAPSVVHAPAIGRAGGQSAPARPLIGGGAAPAII